MDSLIKPLTTNKVTNKAAFGRHETFALRYSWLTKGFQVFQNDPDIFSSDEATVQLGVGKNMVNAIRYWLRATQMIEMTNDGLKTTELGIAIFSEQGWDPYLEDEATLWLIHWMLATNSQLSTTWYWFFNCFHKIEFTHDEVATHLAKFVVDNLSGKHSERTVKNEINIILRMYYQGSRKAKVELEDILDAPLSTLKLITGTAHTQYYQSKVGHQESVPIEIIGFAVNEVLNQRKQSVLPISELMYGVKNGVAIGSVFRLTEGELLAKLERLVENYGAVFKINETAGINQLYRDDDSITSLTFLKKYYQPQNKAES